MGFKDSRNMLIVTPLPFFMAMGMHRGPAVGIHILACESTGPTPGGPYKYGPVPTHIVEDFKLKKVAADGMVLPDPAIVLDGSAAQKLIDGLWQAGVRPSEDVTPKQGELDATRRHLDDVRQLLFDVVGTAKPK